MENAADTSPLFSLFSHLWLLWMMGAVLAGALEIIVPSFVFLLMSIAALITALIASSFSWIIQLESFSVILIGLLVLIRPRLIAKLQTGRTLPSRTQILLGKTGEVTEAIDPALGFGRVVVEGQDWAASAFLPIAAGKIVMIENSDGIVLQVKEI
jgi:membrane protein implicated in regulation of membrane protease activity